MTSLILASSLFTALTYTQTTSVSCTPVLFPFTVGNNGTANMACDGFNAGSNGVIDSVTLYVTPDYTNGLSATNSFRFTYSPAPPFAGGPFTVTGGGSSSGAVEHSLGTDTPGTQSYTAFVVAVTSLKLTGSAVATSSVGRVEYTYTINNPEPSTVLCTGAGLLGLAGFLRHRRKT